MFYLARVLHITIKEEREREKGKKQHSVAGNSRRGGAGRPRNILSERGAALLCVLYVSTERLTG